MSSDIQNGPNKANSNNTLVVRVRYIASNKPFVDSQAQLEVSLATFKPSVLSFFELSEGNVDGGTKTYHFALDGDIQSDLAATLSSLADGKHELKLDLIERFEQG